MEELTAAAAVLAMDVESNAGQDNPQAGHPCDVSGFADTQEAAPEPFAAGKENITNLPEQEGRRAAIDKVSKAL